MIFHMRQLACAIAASVLLILGFYNATAAAQSDRKEQPSFYCVRKTDPQVPLLIVVPVGSDTDFESKGYEKVLCPLETDEIEKNYRSFCRGKKSVGDKLSSEMQKAYGLSFDELCGAVSQWTSSSKSLRRYESSGKRVFKKSKGDLE